MNSSNEEVLDLDIGGTTGVKVSKSLLCQVPNSALEAMFSGRHSLKKIDGKIFVDRDPETFKMLITYLRNGLQVAPPINTESS